MICAFIPTSPQLSNFPYCLSLSHSLFLLLPIIFFPFLTLLSFFSSCSYSLSPSLFPSPFFFPDQIGIFATGLALLSFLFNAFFSLVFALNSRLRRSALYYFGVLALLDLALALNYLALMSVPVYSE